MSRTPTRCDCGSYHLSEAESDVLVSQNTALRLTLQAIVDDFVMPRSSLASQGYTRKSLIDKARAALALGKGDV